MKAELIASLREYKGEISTLKRDVGKLTTGRVSRKGLRNAAEKVASRWVEEFRSRLEHKFKIDKAVIEATAAEMKNLNVLSRPNNLKSSYTKCLNKILKDFDDKFILPIQHYADDVHEVTELQKLLATIVDPGESEYLKEAIDCAEAGFLKAAIVRGWCAAVDRMQRRVILTGLQAFNDASRKVKAQTSGKYKRWNKEFNVTTIGELQTVFDTDLIVVLEGLELLDGNQSERLGTNFQYRNHSAHPGEAPVEPAHLVSFFTDINKIILTNPKFALGGGTT
jgi:hypothetical protein